MPFSILLLGVFQLFLNFDIGFKTYLQFGFRKQTINLISLFLLLLFFIKPFSIQSTIYIQVSFFVLLFFAIYFFVTQEKRERILFLSTFVSFFGAVFLLNLFLPFLLQELYDNTFFIVAAILSLFLFLVNKNLKISFSTIFLSFPLVSLITFLMEKSTNSFATLLFGTGNLFELSFFIFSIVYLLTGLQTVKIPQIFHKKRNPAKNKLKIGEHKNET